MKLQDKIYTKEELEKSYLKFSDKNNDLVIYKDNIGNQYFFSENKNGLQYLSTIKNKPKICSGWGN